MPEKEDIDINLESLEEVKNSDKMGEVCAADTDDVITLKIKNRPDDLKIGQPVIIETQKTSEELLYYCLINRLYYPKNDLAEKFANSPFTGLIPPSQIDGVRGKEFYGLADLNCLKLINSKEGILEVMREFDTIPPIFSKGREVKKEEINLIYKTSEHSESPGTLRGFQYEIPIDFEVLVKKPYGLFGRTGMGKSILNKILCLYILKHQVSQLLLFDMQGEYGMVSRADKSKGLKFYFHDKIQIYRLGELEKEDESLDDSESFIIYKDNITSGDIIASAQTLKEPSINELIRIENLMKDGDLDDNNLLDAINNISKDDIDEHDINPLSLRALRNRIIRFDRYNFLIDRPESEREDSLKDIFNKLLDGKSIVIDFGKFGTTMHLYFFIANMITRRLYNIYSQKEDESELPPLVVVVEEAHKFLKSNLIRHTIFDRIAREMRKFQLTLAFVDQRPSQIDDEVYSQIANSFIMSMNNDKDIDQVVKTLQNSKTYRGIISGLLKRQCFVFGDAIAVPTIMDVLNYNDESLVKTKLDSKELLSETLKKIDDTDMTKIFPND